MMNHATKLIFAGATVFAWTLGCSTDDTTTATATATTTTSASTATASTSATAGAGGATGGAGGGAGNCAQGADSPCEICGKAKCNTEALACAKNSECAANGDALSGCLLLVNCSATKCNGDPICTVSMCTKELESAGGLAGPGTAAAQALGMCVQGNCQAECLPMGTGGSK